MCQYFKASAKYQAPSKANASQTRDSDRGSMLLCYYTSLLFVESLRACQNSQIMSLIEN